MRVTLVALFAVALMSESSHGSDRNYLCVGDMATGFKYNGAKWESVNFFVNDSKFAVKISGLAVEVTKIGDSYPMASCDLYAEDAGQFSCGGLGFGFVMNFRSLRFQTFYGIGYIAGEDGNDPDTPAITIGKCSPL